MQVLIDLRGVVWDEQEHPAVRCDLGNPCGYTVSDFGTVHVRILDDATTVRFDPRGVSKPTLVATFYLIASYQPRRIALCCEGDGASVEIFSKIGQALRRFRELVEAHASDAQAKTRRRQVAARHARSGRS